MGAEDGSGSSTTTVENLVAQPSEDPPSGEAAEQDVDSSGGVNEWVAEWDMTSEPWTFLVDGSGIIQARFEGAMSARELTEALEQALL